MTDGICIDISKSFFHLESTNATETFRSHCTNFLHDSFWAGASLRVENHETRLEARSCYGPVSDRRGIVTPSSVSRAGHGGTETRSQDESSLGNSEEVWPTSVQSDWIYVASSDERAFYDRDQYRVVQPHQGRGSDTAKTEELPESQTTCAVEKTENMTTQSSKSDAERWSSWSSWWDSASSQTRRQSQ